MINLRELDVLNILWAARKPMTSADIVREKKGLTQSTVTAVLRKLLSKGMVETVGITHSGKVLSRMFQPVGKSKQYVLESFADLYRSCRSILTVEEIAEKLGHKG